MGADLILGWIMIRKGLNINLLEKAILSNIDKLSKMNKEIRAYYDYNFGEVPDNLTISKVKKEFREIVEKTFKAINGNYRDVGIMEHKGDIIYISGGMSYGDMPTDSCDLFNKFNSLPENLTEPTRKELLVEAI